MKFVYLNLTLLVLLAINVQCDKCVECDKQLTVKWVKLASVLHKLQWSYQLSMIDKLSHQLDSRSSNMTISESCQQSLKQFITDINDGQNSALKSKLIVITYKF